MASILTYKGINMQTKLRTLKCHVWSKPIYDCENSAKFSKGKEISCYRDVGSETHFRDKMDKKN